MCLDINTNPDGSRTDKNDEDNGMRLEPSRPEKVPRTPFSPKVHHFLSFLLH